MTDAGMRPPIPPPVAEERVIAVARRLPAVQLERTAEVLVETGIRVLEITMDTPGATDLIERLSGANRLVGAGTVHSRSDAADAIAAGAAFVVSPHTDVELVRWVASRGIPVVPGAFTPTELDVAWSAGASAVKLFPAGVGGPSLLRALRGPFSKVPLIPSGGVDAASAGDWLRAGAVALGVGGWLTDQGDPDVVRRRAQRLLREVRATAPSA